MDSVPMPDTFAELCKMVVDLGCPREEIIPQVHFNEDGTLSLYATRPPSTPRSKRDLNTHPLQAVYLGHVNKKFNETSEVDAQIHAAGRFVLVRWGC